MSLARLAYAASAAGFAAMGGPEAKPWNETDPAMREMSARATADAFFHPEDGLTAEQLATRPDPERLQGCIFRAIVAEAAAMAAEEGASEAVGDYRILCDNPNLDASQPVNGVSFEADRGQFISQPVSREVAERFARIPGYQMIKPPAAAKPAGLAELGDGDAENRARFEADLAAIRDIGNAGAMAQLAQQLQDPASPLVEQLNDAAASVTATDTPPPAAPEEPPTTPPAEVTEQAPPAEPATTKPGKPGKAKPATATAA